MFSFCGKLFCWCVEGKFDKLMRLVILLIAVAICGFEKAGYSDGKSRT